MARLQHAVDWRLAASPDDVWTLLADYERWPSWWKGIQSVELVRPGRDDGVGSVLRQHWHSRLPFTLCFDLEVLRIEAPRLLGGRASGDLEGTCTWTLEDTTEEDTTGCRVRFSADVRAGRWWMRLPVPFADQVFRAEFEAVMGWGIEGLGRTLDAKPREPA